MKNKIKTILKPELSTSNRQPYFDAKVSAGFPSPAADYEEGRLDLNQYLIKNPPSTFFVRVTGDSMVGAGIHSGDLLIVDRSLTAKDKHVIIAAVGGQLTVKRIRIRQKKICLEPENKNYAPQEIGPDEDFQVWGVVTHVIHPL
jgi:DNA polymerase V